MHCGEGPFEALSYCCISCNYDCCKKCFEFTKNSEIIDGGHPHKLQPIAFDDKWVCSICKFNGTARKTKFFCSQCNFNLCFDCRFKKIESIEN